MSLNRRSVAVATLTLTFAAVGSVVAQGVSIERVAPPGAFLVVSTKDAAGVQARFEALPLGQMLVALESEEGMADWKKEREAGLEAMADELGIEVADIVAPGACGLALFVERNEELDAPGLGFVAFVDFGDRAEQAAKLIDAIAKQAALEGGVSLEEVQLGSRTATIVPLPSVGEDDSVMSPPPGVPGGPPRQVPGMGPSMTDLVQPPENLVFAREGSTWLFASSVPALDEAFEGFDGKATKTLADDDQYQAVAAGLGSQDISLVVVVAPLAPLAEPFFIGPAQMLKPVLTSLFGGMRGMAIGATLDGEIGQIELTGTVGTDGEPRGLLGLFREATPIQAPPTLGGESCSSYSRMNFNFPGLVELIEGTLDGFGQEERGMIEPMLMAYMPALQKACGSLGPAMHQFVRLGGEGEGTSLWAIDCADQKAVVPFVNLLAPQAGLMPEDFQGQTVFRDPTGAMPMELGFSASSMLMGDTDSVEQGLRTTGDAGAKGLAADALYRSCQGVIAAGPVSSWGYNDLVASFEAAHQAALSAEGQDDGFVDEAGDPITPQLADAMPDSLMDGLASLDGKLLSKYLGPLVWEIRPVTNGLRQKLFLLRPSTAAAD